eukprot:14584409-Heterocapsa_arctica.AAC.1
MLPWGGHIHADLWKRIWWSIADKGGRKGVAVVKVKAQSTRQQVLDGAVRSIDKAANDYADQGAKLGAKMHPTAQLADARCGRTWQITTVVAKSLAR